VSTVHAASLIGLGDLPGRGFQSYAYGVSADGSVVVGIGSSELNSDPFRSEAFRWTSGGGMVGLGDLPGSGFQSLATGVSADGSVVVGQGLGASGFEAFRWTSGGGMSGLGDLPGGGFFSLATGVSADGSVVVGYGDGASGNEAFRWTSSGGMVGLGDLPGGFFGSGATGVSGDGSVVVGIGSGASGREAFVWTPGAGMQSLQFYLTGLGVDTTGWGQYDAVGVSADGSTIVGVGTNPSGFTEAFAANIAPIPEPETWLLFAVGFGLLAVARRSSFRVA
jgi:probable HAF family extracellular repeat protein